MKKTDDEVWCEFLDLLIGLSKEATLPDLDDEDAEPEDENFRDGTFQDGARRHKRNREP